MYLYHFQNSKSLGARMVIQARPSVSIHTRDGAARSLISAASIQDGQV